MHCLQVLVNICGTCIHLTTLRKVIPVSMVNPWQQRLAAALCT